MFISIFYLSFTKRYGLHTSLLGDSFNRLIIQDAYTPPSVIYEKNQKNNLEVYSDMSGSDHGITLCGAV